jgi:hypothetical protein
MASDDRTYFLKRAKEEEAAVCAATNPSARARHEELASSYRMRFLYLDREAKGQPAPALALPEIQPFIAAPEPVAESSHVPPIEILVR